MLNERTLPSTAYLSLPCNNMHVSRAMQPVHRAGLTTSLTPDIAFFYSNAKQGSIDPTLLWKHLGNTNTLQIDTDKHNFPLLSAQSPQKEAMSYLHFNPDFP